MNWLQRVEPMYSNIFTDIHIDDRRMRKHLDDVVETIDTRPTGPDAWDLIQMAQADEQWAAYLALNPDPITGLIPREPQEGGRPLPERDRPEVREPRKEERSDLDRFLHEYHGGGW